MSAQTNPKLDLDAAAAAEHVTKAQALLKALEAKIGEHPELGQAIHKLESALAILGVQTGGML
jgi:hypothetical protein